MIVLLAMFEVYCLHKLHNPVRTTLKLSDMLYLRASEEISYFKDLD